MIYPTLVLSRTVINNELEVYMAPETHLENIFKKNKLNHVISVNDTCV